MSTFNGSLSSIPTVEPSTSVDGQAPPKRKRLSKACEYCHKSKRRCDGFGPCNNCTFARRKCRYLDPSKREVPPPNGPAVRLPEGWQSSGDSIARPPTPVPTSLDAHFALLEPTVVNDLVSIFFASCHPLTLMIHRPSFLYDLSRGRVPSFLLLSIFAVAAPFATQFHAHKDQPWQAGNHFALQASSEIFKEEFIGQHTLDPPDSINSLRITSSLELAQSLCMLHTQRNVMRHEGKPDGFLVLALQTLQHLNVSTLDAGPPPLSVTHASYVKAESLRRTFWTVYELASFSKALTGNDMLAMHPDSQVIQLPVENALFELPMVDVKSGPSYNYLVPQPDQRKLRSEFGNLLRITSIYTTVLSIIAKRRNMPDIPEGDHVGIQAVERDFQRWVDLLPDQLRLTDENLQVRITQMDHGFGAGGWCFAYMHALCECTMLALHECNDALGSSDAPRPMTFREQKAVDNLVRILNALGARGRSNCSVAVLLVRVAKHSTFQHQHQVVGWLEEYERRWGVRLADYLDPWHRYKLRRVAGTPSGRQSDENEINTTPQLVNGSSRDFRTYGSSGSSRNSGLSDGNSSLSMTVQEATTANRDETHRRLPQYNQNFNDTTRGSFSQGSAALGLSNLGSSPEPQNNHGLETLAAAVGEITPLSHQSPSRSEQSSANPPTHSRVFGPYGNLSVRNSIDSSTFTTHSLPSHTRSNTRVGNAFPLHPVSRANGLAVIDDDEIRSESPSPLNSLRRGGYGQRSYERGTHRQPNFNGHEGGHNGLMHAHAGSRHGHSLSLE